MSNGAGSQFSERNKTREGDNDDDANTGCHSLVDQRGRIARKLRISVTDRCNFSCLFCMPSKNSIKWIPNEQLLTFEEIARITQILSSLGIEKVRITGGEPLLREGLETLISLLSKIKGIRSIDMTTNGWFLSSSKARALRKAGVRSMTMSLHSLKRDRFKKISGIDGLQRIIDSIDAAREAGFYPIKINTVAIKGYNDDEIIDIVNFAKERGLSLRFIEFMPLDGQNIWNPEMVVSGRQIIDIISKHYKLNPKKRSLGDTATTYELTESANKIGYRKAVDIGLITPISNPFCADCDRIRLTADGKLLLCLFDSNYYDLKPFLRSGIDKICQNRSYLRYRSGLEKPGALRIVQYESDKDKRLADYITSCVLMKPPGIEYMTPLSLEKMREKKPRAMYGIGG